MIKKLPLCLLLLLTLPSFHWIEKPAIPASSDSENLLPGKWLLSKIVAKGNIDVIPRSEEGVPVSSDGTIKVKHRQIPLIDYLNKQLFIGVTKFIFKDDFSYEFFRKDKVTHSGKWLMEDKKLTFEFSSGESNIVKVNKIKKLNSTELVMESESHNKPVIFYFTRQ